MEGYKPITLWIPESVDLTGFENEAVLREAGDGEMFLDEGPKLCEWRAGYPSSCKFLVLTSKQLDPIEQWQQDLPEVFHKYYAGWWVWKGLGGTWWLSPSQRSLDYASHLSSALGEALGFIPPPVDTVQIAGLPAPAAEAERTQVAES